MFTTLIIIAAIAGIFAFSTYRGKLYVKAFYYMDLLHLNEGNYTQSTPEQREQANKVAEFLFNRSPLSCRYHRDEVIARSRAFQRAKRFSQLAVIKEARLCGFKG